MGNEAARLFAQGLVPLTGGAHVLTWWTDATTGGAIHLPMNRGSIPAAFDAIYPPARALGGNVAVTLDGLFAFWRERGAGPGRPGRGTHPALDRGGYTPQTDSLAKPPRRVRFRYLSGPRPWPPNPLAGGHPRPD